MSVTEVVETHPENRTGESEPLSGAERESGGGGGGGGGRGGGVEVETERFVVTTQPAINQL